MTITKEQNADIKKNSKLYKVMDYERSNVPWTFIEKLEGYNIYLRLTNSYAVSVRLNGMYNDSGFKTAEYALEKGIYYVNKKVKESNNKLRK